MVFIECRVFIECVDIYLYSGSYFPEAVKGVEIPKKSGTSQSCKSHDGSELSQTSQSSSSWMAWPTLMPKVIYSRGLRLAEGKRDLKVLDFIGNYKKVDLMLKSRRSENFEDLLNALD